MSISEQNRRTDLPIKVFGRRVKPLALAASVATMGVAFGPVYTGSNSSFDFDSTPGVIQAAVAIITVLLFWLGWWANSSRFAQLALLLGAGIFAARASLSMMEVGALHPSVWLSFGWTLACAGSYLLERLGVEYLPEGGRE